MKAAVYRHYVLSGVWFALDVDLDDLNALTGELTLEPPAIPAPRRRIHRQRLGHAPAPPRHPLSHPDFYNVRICEVLPATRDEMNGFFVAGRRPRDRPSACLGVWQAAGERRSHAARWRPGRETGR